MIAHLLIALALAAPAETSLTEAQAAIEANLKTGQGKAFEEAAGTALFEKNRDALRNCKQGAGPNPESFWMLVKLDSAGVVRELLLHPATPMGACARTALIGAATKAPPHDSYWIGIYLRLSS